ncbi:unnamed protein product, partial [Ixodes hexagonus]
MSSDHSAYVNVKSHNMLIYSIAGYEARKVLKTTQCQTCASCLTTERRTATASDPASSFTVHFDNGGLMYPCVSLKKAVTLLEESFTTFFSLNKLYEKSIVDFSAFLARTSLP